MKNRMKFPLSKNLHFLAKLVALVIFTMISINYSSEKQDSSKIRVLVITGGHAFEHEAFFEMFHSLSGITYTEVFYFIIHYYSLSLMRSSRYKRD